MSERQSRRNADPCPEMIRVWDLPLRIFHWLLAAAVVGALITGWLGGNLMAWHGRLGLAVLGLLVFRLLWGVLGSTYARWTHICVAPFSLLAYWRGEWREPGHSPLGALAVLGLLGLVALQVASGLFASDDIAFNGPLRRLLETSTADWLTGLHRQAQWLLVAMIGLHLVAIAFYQRVRQRPLVRAMLDGQWPREHAEQRVAEGGPWWALLLAIALALLAVWAVQMAATWWAPPPAAVAPPALSW